MSDTTILALSPHTDDAELGAGGTILKWVESGALVKLVAFSTGYDETGATVDEFQAAVRCLGLNARDALYCEGLNARRFDEDRQFLLDYLIELRDQWHPSLVLIPASPDIHQDHQVLHIEAQRAFRNCSVLGYELPRGTTTAFDGRYYERLKSRHLLAKQAAVAAYRSQNERAYTDPQAISSLARVRGLQVGAVYAECFEVVRWISG